MSDQTNNVLVVTSSGVQSLGSTDRLKLSHFQVTGDVDFTGATLTGVTATGIADATASLSLDGSGNLTETALVSIDITPSGAMTLRGGGASKFGDDTGYFNFDGSGAVTSSGIVTLSLRGTGTSSFGDDTGLWTFDGLGALASTGVTTFDLDCSGALQINSSGGAISLGNDAVNQAVNLGTGGTRTVTVGSSTATLALNSTGGGLIVKVPDNSGTAFKIQDGTNNRVALQLDTTDGNEEMDVSAKLVLAGTSGVYPLAISATAGAALSVGDLVAISGTSGRFSQADADSGTAALQNLAGVCVQTAGANGNPTQVARQGLCSVTFDANVTTADHGKRCYLSATAGKATLTAPTASGSTVWLVGLVQLADGTASAVVLLAPQFIAVNS